MRRRVRGDEQAVADGVNVNYDVFRTQVTAAGGKVGSDYYADLRDQQTRKLRW